MPYDSAAAREQIKSYTEGKATPADLELFVSMSDLLGQGKTTVLPQLVKLESALQHKVGAQLQAAAIEYFNSQGKREAAKGKQPAQDKDERFRKLVTNQMAALETAHGFAPADYPIYLGQLSDSVFEQNTSRHFKDLINPFHGEYTHRLQWYIVMSGGLLDGLVGPDVMKTILGFSGLWDVLFDRYDDRNPLQIDGSDFRRPENLNRFLMTNPAFAADCPLLHNFFKARYQKRLVMKEAEGTWKRDYIARKKFQLLNYEKASSEQKAAIDTIANSNLLEV